MPLVRLQGRGPSETVPDLTSGLAAKIRTASVAGEAFGRMASGIGNELLGIAHDLIKEKARSETIRAKAELTTELNQITLEEQTTNRDDPSGLLQGAYGYETYEQRVSRRANDALERTKGTLQTGLGQRMFADELPDMVSQLTIQTAKTAQAMQLNAARADTFKYLENESTSQRSIAQADEAVKRIDKTLDQSGQILDPTEIESERAKRRVETYQNAIVSERARDPVAVDMRILGYDPKTGKQTSPLLSGRLPSGIEGKFRDQASDNIRTYLADSAENALAALTDLRPEDLGDRYATTLLETRDNLEIARKELFDRQRWMWKAVAMDGHIRSYEERYKQAAAQLDHKLAIYGKGVLIASGAAASGGPRDPDTVEGANLVSAQELPRIRQLAPPEQAREIMRLTDRFGFMPDPVVRNLDAMFRGGAQDVETASRTVLGLLEMNQSLLDAGATSDDQFQNYKEVVKNQVRSNRIMSGLDDTHVQTALRMKSLIDANVPVAQAVELARKSAVPADRSPLAKQYEEQKIAADKAPAFMQSDLKSLFRIDPDFPAGMAADYEALLRASYFRSNGDLDIARKQASLLIQRSWGLSQFSTDGKSQRTAWKKFAPEAIFGPDGGSDAQWIRTQVVNQAAPMLKDITDFNINEVELVAVPPSSNLPDPTRPGYVLWHVDKKDGLFRELPDKNGKPLVFQPDFKNSPERALLEIESEILQTKGGDPKLDQLFKAKRVTERQVEIGERGTMTPIDLKDITEQ